MRMTYAAVIAAGIFAMSLAAHAQTSNVVLYGRLNVDLEFVKGRQPDGSDPSVSRLSSNSSRFGLRGTEALGNGLSAIFQIESSINADTNGGNLGGRDTYVGFQGPWGTFKMGNMFTPTDEIHAIFGNAPTFLTSILETNALWAQGFTTKGAGGFDSRLGNSLRYDSPSLKGLTFSGQVALRDSSGATDAADDAGNNGNHTQELRHAYVIAGNAMYSNGPIQVGVSFEQNKKVRGPGLDDTDVTLTGGYDFGIIRPALVYEYMKYDTPTGDLKRDLWGASVTIETGRSTWYAFYGRAGDGRGSAADGERVGGLTRGSDTASAQWEISYTYSFSKRTKVYAGYVKLDNDRRAAYTFANNPYAINTSCQVTCTQGSNGKPGGFVLGMIQIF